MQNLLTEIDSYLSRGTLVFPSQIAAEFWRRAAVVRSGRSAIREDAVISWDTFKENAFDIRRDAIPTNRTIRTVFAQQTIRENAQKPLLRELVPPDYASEAIGFTATIEGVLPRIPSALAAMRTANSPRLVRVRHDLEVLGERYATFMNKLGLFEPKWLEAAQHFRGGNYQLVAPALADDFPEFQPVLSQLPRIDPGLSSDAELVVYGDAKSELRSVLRSIARLLDEGTDPEEIILTVGDLESLSDRLRQEGEKYQVPLVVRAGRTLAESAVGRFIREMGEVVSSGFAVGPVEHLLLNRGIPWADPALNAALVVSGIANGAIGGSNMPDPRWARAGKPSGGHDPGGLWRLLRGVLPKIANAASFADLRSSFNQFLSGAVVRSGWSAANERVLERSQEELRSLAAVEADTGLRVDNPYAFWLDRLGEHQYVPQHAGSGVAVLPYRVGAATCPEHHFVMNATHSATSVVIRPFPFLSEADRDELGAAASERDLSTAFLNAYAVSGRSVSFSASRSTFEGAALPAGFFVSRDRVKEASDETLRQESAADAFKYERDIASRDAGTTSPDAMPLQVLGATEYVRGALTNSGPDFTRDPIADPQLLESAVRRVRSKTNPGLLVLSASHIDSFRACPFGYLLSRCLGLNELTLEITPDDPMEMGRLYHDILAEFFDHLAESGAAFDSQDLPALHRALAVVADRLFAQRRGMIPNVVYDATRKTFDRIADSLLRNDAGLIDGHKPLLVEAWQQERESQDGVLLVGRVDRVTQAPDGSITLVDYKKSGLPTRVSVNAGAETATGVSQMSPAQRSDQTLRMGSVQIPLYVRLLESGDHRVAAAGYYGLEKAAYLAVFGNSPGSGKACMSRERLDEVMELVDDLVVSITGRVNGGDFTCDDECAGCSMRSVCRTRFYVR